MKRTMSSTIGSEGEVVNDTVIVELLSLVMAKLLSLVSVIDGYVVLDILIV